MATYAGYNTVIKKGGTTTAFTGEAMGGSGAGPYQITDATKRVLDRDFTPTFYDDEVEIDAADILSIDYLFGKVTFTGAKTGPITADGKYIPVAAVAQARSYSLQMSAELLDDTTLDSAQADGGARSRLAGLNDVSCTLGRVHDLATTFPALLAAGTPLLIEIQSGGAGRLKRGWFVCESDNQSGDVGALEMDELTFQLDGDAEAAFGFGT